MNTKETDPRPHQRAFDFLFEKLVGLPPDLYLELYRLHHLHSKLRENIITDPKQKESFDERLKRWIEKTQPYI